MDVTIVNEYGVDIEQRVLFPWEPVMFLQNRLSNMLCYPVKLYCQGIEKHPCHPWMDNDREIVCKEVFPISIWNKILELQDERFQGINCKIVNTTNGIEVQTDVINDIIDNKIQFQVRAYPSDNEMPWTLSVPMNRLDIMDAITGDLSVTKAELLYIDIVMESFDEDIENILQIDNELLEHLCIVIRVYDLEGECRYHNNM
jgi:hypothetical protein